MNMRQNVMVWKGMGTLFIMLFLSFFCCGCIIPCPHIKQTCEPVNGIVVDEADKTPVENARLSIAYPDGGKRTTKTDTNGHFSFPAKHRFHWGILFGVALNHSLPFDCYAPGFTVLNISAEGYTMRTAYPDFRRHPDVRVDDPGDLYLKVGLLEGLYIPLYNDRSNCNAGAIGRQ